MIKRLTLTEDHLKLIRLLDFQVDESTEDLILKKNDPYLLSGRLQDIALALGYMDKAIPGTEEDPEGAAFPDDIEEYLLGVHHYIVDNLYFLETLIHQMVLEGGITPGTYKCIDNELIWSREE